MNGPEQATPAATAIPAESSNETGSISAENPQPVTTTSPRTPPGPTTPATLQVDRAKGLAPPTLSDVRKERERIQGRKDDLEKQRSDAVDDIQRISAAIEKATISGQVTRLTGLHNKRRVTEERLEELANEEEVLARHLDGLQQEENGLQVEQEAAARRQIQEEGRMASAKLHACLAVGSQLFQELLELGDGDRIAKDRLRSMAPARMTDCPDFFSYEGSGVAPDLKAVFAQTFGELGRWNRELQRREQARVAAPGGVPTGGS